MAPATTARAVPAWRDWIAPIVLVIASLAVGIVHAPNHTSLSPVDELVYVDYFAKVGDEFAVHRGEELGDLARDTLDCEGQRSIVIEPLPDCLTDPVRPDLDYPAAAVNYANVHTPLYFAITKVVAQPLVWLGVDLIDAGRFVGAIWLAAASVFLYLALRRLKIPRLPAVGAGLLMIGSLPAYWYNTYLSPDATAYLSGALLLYLAIRALQESRGYWMFVAGAVLVTIFKFQNIAVVLALSLMLVLYAAYSAYASRTSRGAWVGATIRSREAITGVLAVVASFAFEVAWTVYQSVTALDTAQPVDSPAITARALVRESFLFLTSLSSGVDSPDYLGTGSVVMYYGLMWVLIAGVVGLAVTARGTSLESPLAHASMIGVVVIGPLLVLILFVATGVYYPIPARYGMSIIPVLLACAALLFSRTRLGSLALTGVGVAVLAASLTLPVSN
jgi:hypothetical protein